MNTNRAFSRLPGSNSVKVHQHVTNAKTADPIIQNDACPEGHSLKEYGYKHPWQSFLRCRLCDQKRNKALASAGANARWK